MNINLPASAFPLIRLLIKSPVGDYKVVVAGNVKQYELDLPEGVSPDEVRVEYEFLTGGKKVVASGVLKEAVEKPVEPIVDPKFLDGFPPEPSIQDEPEDGIADDPGPPGEPGVPGDPDA